ncbi:hypothetical protein DFH08DRAFT_1043981 [Mycena albidolilacea]|uniref:Helicase C-terminal domain-containing protein n=1 Tax=Mycena albidolilacea TaxID=1033008 RepID=A0AAD6ZAD0_9AGAR|nr:hypothetical protein DFH08DRAFT_1043981 [Mycena albidolilacea]
MLVVFSPKFNRLLHSKNWQAHLPYLTHSWRPSYSRIYILREIVGLDVPLICLSATCPKSFRNVLLSTIVLPMEHDITSFLDIAFILPLGCREADLIKTLKYVDDIELLTKMFWWAYQRAASTGLLDYVIDIVHSGLSVRHQEICLEGFRTGRTAILLGSSKISTGMNFPGVCRVIQYKCCDLTIPDFDQRRGRGARYPGEFSVSMIFVEPSMLEDHISVENPKSQDPGIIELIKSDECIEAIIQRCLENESWSRDPSFPCCNRCTPDLRPAREFQFIAEHWKEEWRTQWPSYGPKSLISDSGLEDNSLWLIWNGKML